MGLFYVILGRVMAVVAVTITILVIASQINQDRYLEQAWREDLRQEAAWTASHFGFAQMSDPTKPVGWQASLREGWRAAHDTVRMTLRDEHDAVIFDSDPESEPPTHDSRQHLTGYARIERPTGDWELLLSRPRPAVFSVTFEILMAGLGAALIAGLLLFPLTHSISRSLSALGQRARGIADGQFGQELPISGAREIRELAGAFNTMSARLKVEGLRRRQLIADVSHELRSPLGRLRALGETLRRHPDEYVALLTQSEEEIALLNRLISDLLDTARLEEGQGDIKLEEVSLRQWWEQAGARLSKGLKLRELTWRSEFIGHDRKVQIDGQRLLQALGNVVDNAAAASTPGGAITARLCVDVDGWRIDVADRGRGIASEALPFIFDRFYRADPDRGRDTGGAGLGLSIVKAIVEAHGGQVEIQSTVGEGACVTFRFNHNGGSSTR